MASSANTNQRAATPQFPGPPLVDIAAEVSVKAWLLAAFVSLLSVRSVGALAVDS
jgi:hypothetical protein